MKTPNSSHISPAEVWHLGFTGHRALANPSVVNKAIRRFLEEQHGQHPQMVAVSSYADGADRLFVKAVLDLGIPWIAICPMGTDEFKKDFDQASAKEAENLLSKAAEVQIAGAHAERPEAYLEAGLAIVKECDYLLAVWDGNESHGTGGTAEIIGYARATGIEVAWVQFETGLQRTLEPTDDLSAIERRVPTREEFLRDHAKLVPLELLREFEQQDLVASGKAPKIRRLTLQMALFETLAALAALASFKVFERQQHGLALVLAFCKVLFIGWAVWLARRLRRLHEREAWLVARVKAELCRSAITTWAVTGRTPSIKHLGAEDFDSYMRWLRFIQLKHGWSFPPALSFEQRKLSYRRYRIWDQLEGYYRGQAAVATRLHRRMSPAHDIATKLALIVSLCGFFYTINVPETKWWHDFWSIGVGKHARFVMLNLAPFALPTFATWMVTWMAVDEVQRRERCYSAMVRRLEALDLELVNCRSQNSLEHVISQTERLILNEVMEWYGSALHGAK